MLPMYKQADQYRKDCLDKDSLIKELEDRLSTAKSSQPNGMSIGGDVAYWKNKYESLLATVGG